MKIESMRWLKSQLKHKVSITKGLLIAFMITGTVMSYSEGSEESVSSNQSSSGVNVTINNYGEQTGLELGDNSRARGIGSVSTGRNGIAVGNNAVATGENETKETIQEKLKENKQKLEEIANAKKEIADKAEELRLKQITERETIEAGIRVEDLRNAKEVAREHWQNKLSAYNQKKSENEVLLTDYKNKIADLNRRLNAVGSLGDININSAEGLEAAADKLKTKVEENTNLNLTKEFYKNYVVNYYKVLGDLRRSEEIWGKTRGDNNNGLNMANYNYLKEHDPNILKSNLEDVVIPVDGAYGSGSVRDSSSYSKSSASRSTSSNYNDVKTNNLEYSPYAYNALGSYELTDIGSGLKGMYTKGKGETVSNSIYNVDGEQINTYLDLDKDVTNEIEFQKWNNVKEKWRTKIHEYNAKLGDQFLGKVATLTDGKSTEYYNKVTDLKFELVNLDKEITYYHWKYEQTGELKWLDQKKALLVERENKLATNKKTLFELGKKLGFYSETDSENIVSSGINGIIGERYYGAWKKENIDDPKEENKISVDRLTTDLERELNINKQEVIRKERELEDLRQETKQAETNYNSINPSKKDEALYERYTKVKEEITRLASDMKNAETRLKNLQDALTLHDLKNIGENQIAFGTDTLAVGNNSIAMGYKAISVGKDTVSVGARNQSTGEAITALGQDLVTNGNKNISIGNTNVINGENNIVFGRNNNIGESGDANKSNNNIVLGSNITVSKDVTNSITLGAASTPVSNAISVGSTGSERQIKNVKDATDNQDAVTYKQLKEYLKLDGSNVDADEKRKVLAAKLSENSSLTDPKGILVTDTKVKEGLDGKLDKDLTNLDTSKLNEKLAKGNITSTDITVTGGNNSTFTNVTLELSKDLKDKINSVDNKLDKTGSNLNENEKATLLQNLGLNNVATSDDLANKANKDLSNVEKSSIIDKAGDGNLDNLNGGLVTDRVVKSALDKKLNNDLSNLDDAGKETLRTNLDVYKKSEVDSKLEGKANKDASNIEVDKFTTKLNDGANIGTPTTKLVTDKNVKDYLDANYTNNTLLTTKLDAKANKDLSNLSDTDKSTARTNLDVYSKGESDSTFLKKDASNITTEAERKTISGNLSTGADLTTPKGVLVTDSIVKEGLDKKANKDDVYTKDEINDKITGLNVDGLAKKDGSNLDKAAFTTNLTNGANIGTPTDTVVTDKLVKEYLDANYTNNKDLNTKLDTKVNKDLSNLSDAEKSTLRDNLNVYDKTTIDSKLDNKANKSDLESYLKLDGSNLTNDNRAGLITKLTDGANATNPIGALVTDTLLKSTVQDTLAKGLGNIEKGDIISTTLTVTGGENKVFGKDVSVELKENSIETKHIKDGNVTKEKLDDKLKKEIDEKLNKDLSNLKDTEKDTLRNNLDVYKKSEVDSKLDSKANKDASNIEVDKFTTKLNTGANIGTPATKLVTDKDVKNYLDTNYYNKKDLDDKVGGLLNSHLLPGSIGDPNDTDKTYLVTDKQVKEYVDKENSRYNTLSSAGVANAIATASLPQVSNNYTFGISAAGGHYNGQNALAVGISGQSDNGRFIYKIGSALNTKSKFSIGVGATVLFGEIVKPNVMNAKENKELREKNSALESKVEKLEQTVKELLKDKETEKVDKSAENEKLIQSLLDKIKELSSKVEMLDSKTKKVK